LTWAAREALKIASKWVGRQRSSSTFTSIATLPTVETILAPIIAVDTIAGTIGGTPIVGSILGYELVVNTGVQPLFTAEGLTYFNTVKYVKPSGRLRITYEHDTNAAAEYAAFIAGTTRSIRIKHTGSALTGAGTYTVKTFIFDCSALYTSFPPFDERDGDDIITAELECVYNSTEDLFMRFCVVPVIAAVV
jgi:hypothetical protein